VGHAKSVMAAAISGETVVTSGKDGVVKVWNVAMPDRHERHDRGSGDGHSGTSVDDAKNIDGAVGEGKSKAGGARQGHAGALKDKVPRKVRKLGDDVNKGARKEEL
jgi:hypothetical protein